MDLGHPSRSRIKRLVDLLGASALLVCCLPVLVGTAVAVRMRIGTPVLFVQDRPGLGGRPFRLYKFRTMTDARDGEGRLLPDGERLTRLGRWLRASSLDELPELWNVLLGDMSLVGPRPLLVEYLPLYTPRQARRHEVRPGITGWAQVHGRNELTWGERLALDVWYVDHWSLWLDVRVMARTVRLVVARRGVSEEGHATKPLFTGAPDVDVEG